jgi:hypothetical protein
MGKESEQVYRCGVVLPRNAISESTYRLVEFREKAELFLAEFGQVQESRELHAQTLGTRRVQVTPTKAAVACRREKRP